MNDGVASAAIMGALGRALCQPFNDPVTTGRNQCRKAHGVNEGMRPGAILMVLRSIVVFGLLVHLALPSVASAKEHRSREVTREFQREHPCPSTGKTSGACPGYQKDHINPLACGGPDAVSNMQWQTVTAAKAKDRWELRACGR